jgi:hypothetical protein
MSLKRAAVAATGLWAALTVAGLALLAGPGPGVPLVVLAQPVFVFACGLWLALFVERKQKQKAQREPRS